jgi:hypothetical protein
VETKNYRKALKEIIDRVSPCRLEDKRRYIKHQSISDVVNFEDVYDEHYAYAQSRGLPTEKDLLQQLKDDGIWLPKDDAEIEKQRFFIQSLDKNKRNLYLQSAINKINSQKLEAEKKLQILHQQKDQLISTCCEKYAINRANDFYMVSSFFKGADVKEQLFTQEEFEFIEAPRVTALVRVYNDFHRKFAETAIQNLVLQDFYKIYYSFSESCFDFFGSPIVHLSTNQLNLIIYTRVFKNIFDTHDDIPDKIKKDPDALLDYSASSEAREDIKSKLQATDTKGGSTIVGATKDDLEELGLQSSGGKSLHDAAAKKGGKLSMKDLMDLSGV